jgi:hypothetical protein
MIMKIYTNRPPFAADGYTSDSQAIFAAVEGIRPKRPGANTGMYEELWGLVSRCWQHDPDFRPKMQEVVDTVRIAFSCCYLDRTDLI